MAPPPCQVRHPPRQAAKSIISSSPGRPEHEGGLRRSPPASGPVAVFRLWMDEIFETETPEERFERSWADPMTVVLHVRGADHSIPAGERVRYRTIDEAASHDHELCMVCFQAPSDLIGYDEELEMQRAALAQVRREYREVPDRVAQAELQRLGEEMLSDWPAPLKGYGTGSRWSRIPESTPSPCRRGGSS